MSQDTSMSQPRADALGVTHLKPAQVPDVAAKQMAQILRDSIASGTLGPRGFMAPDTLMEDEETTRISFVMGGPLGAYAVTVQPLEKVVNTQSLPHIKREALETAHEATAALVDNRKTNRRHKRPLRFFPERTSGALIFWRRARAKKISDFAAVFAWFFFITRILKDVEESTKPKR